MSDKKPDEPDSFDIVYQFLSESFPFTLVTHLVFNTPKNEEQAKEYWEF